MGDGFVPVLACIGLGRDGQLFNVNADTYAGHLAARLGARRLVIAGTTPGVLGASGATLTELDTAAVADLVNDGTATAGMIAKLRACTHALANGVDDVVIVNGRDSVAALQRPQAKMRRRHRLYESRRSARRLHGDSGGNETMTGW